MEMQGRLRDGIEWITGRERDWDHGNAFAYHNWWHLALYHLDLGEHERVLGLYDTRIRPTQSPVALEMVDASALLWRLTLRGVDVGARWQPLAEAWASIAEDAFYAFNDAHAIMALVGAGDWPRVDRVLASLERAAEGTGTNAMMSRDAGMPLARAIAAFGRGACSEAVEHLLPMRPIAHHFGGSHAQRDLVHLTLVEAALRAGRLPLAAALVAERTELKRTSPFNWRLASRVMDAQGWAQGAQQARETAELRVAAQQRGQTTPRAVA
jgi:hypothetical protein